MNITKHDKCYILCKRRAQRLSCVCSIIRRGPRKWEDSDRGSALMCAQVIKLRLTTCCEARKRRAQRLSCVCSIIRRGPRKWEDSDRGSALMCAQVIKLRLTTCCEARKRRAQRLSCVYTIKKQEEMRKWLAHRTIQ